MNDNGIEAKFKVATDEASESIKKVTNEVKRFKSEILSTVSAISRIIKQLSRLTKYSDQLMTSQRLLNTVLGDSTDKATKFVNSMSEMTGVSEANLNTQIAKFTQLGESFGMGVSQAENFSESLVTLSTKLALLYNADPKAMSEKLSKALAGNKKMLQEATGIVATNTNIQAILYENGINKEISSLNEGELAILRYIAITRQATNDMSVYEQAVNSLAWQKQMLTQQVQRLAAAFGQLLTPILTRVFIVLNAIIITITKIINMIAKLFGITVNLNKSVGSGGVSTAFDDFADSISGAEKAANKSLRSFDKLNNITTPNEGSGSSGKGLSIDSNIAALMGGVNQDFLDINNEAENISKKMLEWLGFTEDENGELHKTRFSFADILVTLGGIVVAFKVLKGLSKVLGAFASLFGGGFAGLLTGLKLLSGIGTTLWGIFEIINAIKDINENGWSFENVIQILRGIALIVAGIALLFGGWQVAAIAGLVVVGTYIAQWIKNHWEEIKKFFTNIWDKLVEIFSPVGEWIWNNVIQPIISFFKPIVDAIVGIETRIWETIKSIVTGVAEAVWTIIKKIGEIFTKVVEIFVAIGKAYYEYVLKPVYSMITSVATWIYDYILKPVIGWFSSVGTWIYNHIISPAIEKFMQLRDKVWNIFKTIGQGIADFVGGAIKGVINGILSYIERQINGFIKMLNGAINIINNIPRSKYN